MKVLTKYPVYINKKKISNADFYYNADDTLPTDPFSYADDYSNNDGKAAAITAGIGAAATLGAALAARQKAPLSEAENKCGKRPKIGKKRKQRWQDCADKFNQQSESGRMMNPALMNPAPPVVTLPPPPPPKKNTMLYVGLGVVALAVVGYFVYKSRTKTATATA
jgi:hypothetical protein